MRLSLHQPRGVQSSQTRLVLLLDNFCVIRKPDTSIDFDPHGQSRKLRIQRVQDDFKRKCQQATSQEMSFNCRLNCHDMNKLSHAGHPSILAHQAHGQFLMLLAHDFIHVCCQHSHAVSLRSKIIKSITQANNPISSHTVKLMIMFMHMVVLIRTTHNTQTLSPERPPLGWLEQKWDVLALHEACRDTGSSQQAR